MSFTTSPCTSVRRKWPALELGMIFASTRRALCALRQDVLHNLAVHVGQAEMAALELVGQLEMVDAQAAKNRGLKVMHMDGIGDHVVAVIVRLAIGETLLHAAAGHPHREASRMVVAAVICLRQPALAVNGAAEFSAPDH